VLTSEDFLDFPAEKMYIFIAKSPEKIGKFVVRHTKSVFIKTNSLNLRSKISHIYVQNDVLRPEQFSLVDENFSSMDDFVVQVKYNKT